VNAWLIKLMGGSLRRDALWSLLLHGASLALTFAIGVCLARVLGPASYGAMTLVLVVSGVLTTVLTFGLPNTLVRRIATHAALAETSQIRSLWRFSLRTATIYSLMVALGLATLLLLLRPGMDVSLLACLLGLATIPMTTLAHLAGGALRGLGRGILSQIIANLLRPAVWLAGLGLLLWLAPAFSYENALAVYLFAVSLTLIVALVACSKALPSTAPAVAPPAPTGVWQEALPFMLISVLAMLGPRLDLVLLSALLDVKWVGLYEVAARGADLVLIPITATTAVLAPEFARRRATNDTVALQKLATLASRGLFFASLAIAIVLAIFAQPLTKLVFGPEYVQSAGALAILSVGYATMMALGPVQIILGMTGHGRQSAIGVILATAAGALLSLLLIPKFGIEGAAIGRASSQVVGAIWLSLLAWRHLGLHTSCWPIRARVGAAAR
jgi:O-antigen/teichoic acid export membrane protein